MNRYRVQIVPKTGRFAPVLTVLVEADTSDEAFWAVQARNTRIKVISAEDVRIRECQADLLPFTPEPQLRLLTP